MSTSRREFIKIGALGLGSMSLSLAPSLFREGPSAAKTFPLQPGDVVEQAATYCEVCFWKCAGWVHSKNGQPWKIIGNEADLHSRGRLCTRGTSGLGLYKDPDRLKRPLLRVDGNGRQTFKEVDWDEALDFIAKRLAMVKQKYGAESLVTFSHGSGGTHWKTLVKAFGSSCIAAPSFAQCRGPRTAGFYLTYGDTVGSPERTDIENSRCMVLIGSHIGENLHNGQVQEMSKALARGCEMVVVDPRFSTAASKAKHWLPIKPATDMALLLAWMHVILEEELYDRDYVARYTTGLAQLKEAVRTNTPEWAYPITTIKPEVIRETARLMARHAPATLVHPGRHVTWYGDDTQRSRAIAILNALLGSWGRKGGFYVPQKASVRAYPHPAFPKTHSPFCERTREKYPWALSAVATDLRDMTLTPPEPDKQIKAWLVYGTNLIYALPEPKKTIDAIRKLDLMVAVDTMPSEICGWADVVLPECTYLERYDDLRISPGRAPQIAVRTPAFKPAYESKSSAWMVKRLANKMGLSEYFAWKNMEEYLGYRLQGIGSSVEEMKEIGVKTLPQEGSLYFQPGEEVKFNTPSGKIELYSKQLADMGFDPVPRYTPYPEPPEGYFRLLQGRSPFHSFSRTTNSPVFTELMRENELWINSTVAADWGLRHGQYIRLQNDRDVSASFPIRVRITERIRPDCVFMVHGFGRSNKELHQGYGKGIDDNELCTTVNIDPLMGGTSRRSNFVTFITEES